MATVLAVLGIAHWIGFAGIVGGYFLSLQRQIIHPLMVWAARLQLLLGLGLVGAGMAAEAQYAHVWLAVKLMVALAVVALCEMSNARVKRGTNKPALLHAAFVLACVNFLVAMMWG